jgi:hypothetical protein
VPPAKRDAFRTDLGLVQEKTHLGVTAKHARAADAHWGRWEKFCLVHTIDPFLQNCDEPIPIIQVFAQQYRDGREAPMQKAVRSGTVEDAVRAVGQAFIQLGARTSGKMLSAPLTSVSRGNFAATARKTPPLLCKTSPNHHHILHPPSSPQPLFHSRSKNHRRRHHHRILLPSSPG